MSRWIAAIGFLVLPLAGCSEPVATVHSGDPQGVIDRVSRGRFAPRVLLTGELESVRAERVRVPRNPAWRVPIRWIARDGTVVSEGDVVAELDNSQFTGELEQLRLNEISAYNDILGKRAEISGELAEKGFALERQRILLEKARIEAEIPLELLAQRDHQEKQLELARAASAFDKARQDLETAERAAEASIAEREIALKRVRDELRTAEEAIDALILEAPRGGLLVVSQAPEESRKLQVGDNVWVGMEVVQIPDLDAMKVVARLSDVDDGLVKVGMRALCTLDMYPERDFAGEVSEIAPVAQEIDPGSARRAFRVVVRLDESDAKIMRPGMSARVTVLPEPREDVLLAPRVAVDHADGGARLLAASGDAIEVTLGGCDPVVCVVEDGADEGLRLRVGG